MICLDGTCLAYSEVHPRGNRRRIMNLKLEELRKRLLDQTAPAAPPTETIYKRSGDSVSPLETPAVTIGIDTAAPRSTQLRETPQSTGQPDLLASTVLQYVGETADPAKSRYQLAQAVTKVFETTKQYQDRLADLANAIDTIEQIAQSATRAFEPIRAFRDQMQKLSSTFEPMRAFQAQLTKLANTFDAVGELQGQFLELSETFRVASRNNGSNGTIVRN